MRSLKIILLSSAFNGLTQRAWLDLRQSGFDPSVVLFTDEATVCRQIEAADADLVICPFLKDRVPQQLWSNLDRPVVIIHPGIVGDRGASALDWAITQQARAGAAPPCRPGGGWTVGRHGIAGGGGDGRRAGLVEL